MTECKNNGLCQACQDFEDHLNVETDIAQLRQMRKTIVAHRVYKDCSLSGRFADGITSVVFTPRGFMVITCWTALWLLWNTLGPVSLRFDPFPAFVLWLFCSNVIQIELMPLFGVTQQRQEAYNQAREERTTRIQMIGDRIEELQLDNLRADIGDMEEGSEF